MTITIQQALHGYKNGHQLLGSSIHLPPDISKVLLFQSDLSGSITNSNFETYITGYPLIEANIYAFARTWYASEMKRPGCVWTHTLLIKFPDLGKIPQLDHLTQYFNRPASNDYTVYELPLEVNFGDLLDKPEQGTNYEFKSLYQNIYESPNSSIVISANTPALMENAILRLWSDQWPRLRRNFYFCTGALSNKSIEERIFDVQIIPIENIRTFERLDLNILFFRTVTIDSQWFNTLKSSNKNSIRQFLWTFGADIEGIRENYIHLINLYHYTYVQYDLQAIIGLLKKHFPSSFEGKNFKTRVFGYNGILQDPNHEAEIIKYLISEKDTSYLNGIELNIEERLLTSLKNNIPYSEELIKILLNNLDIEKMPSFLSKFWANETILSELFKKHIALAIHLVSKSTDIVYSPMTWRTSSDIQKAIINKIYSDNLVIDYNKLTRILLNEKNNIVFEISKRVSSEVIVYYSLDWFNEGNKEQQFTPEWEKYITIEREFYFLKWLSDNQRLIRSKIFALLFSKLPVKKINSLNFSCNTWINAYRKLKLTEYGGDEPLIASVLLSIGLNSKQLGAEYLVAYTFQDVFDFAASRKLNDDMWKIIPKDLDEDTDDGSWDPRTSYYLLVQYKHVARQNIPVWDYCENLIRTICNKAIKQNWHPTVFLSSFRDAHTFYRAANYCSTKKKGRSYIKHILNLIEDKKAEGDLYQIQHLLKLKRISS